MNDQVADEILEQINSNQGAGANGLILTTSDMINFLLEQRVAAARIEELTGSDSGFVKQALNDETVFDEQTAPKQIKRLRTLYIREGMKRLFRKHPFIGAKKAAKKLGISEKESNFVYDSLISSGELKFKMSKPNWEGADTKELLREHVVVD